MSDVTLKMSIDELRKSIDQLEIIIRQLVEIQNAEKMHQKCTACGLTVPRHGYRCSHYFCPFTPQAASGGGSGGPSEKYYGGQGL